MGFQETIGQNIKAYRELMELKQDDLANLLKVQREVISYYENGNREVPNESLKKLSDLFGIELYDLLEENSSVSKTNVAFAFRADGLDQNALNSISSFRKIVKNYLKLVELKEKNER